MMRRCSVINGGSAVKIYKGRVDADRCSELCPKPINGMAFDSNIAT